MQTGTGYPHSEAGSSAYPESLMSDSLSFTDSHFNGFQDLHHHEHQYQHPEDHLQLSQPVLPEHSCSYCGISNSSCVVKCDTCKKWFCNAKTSGGGSHIVNHLVMAKHNVVSLHPNSDLGDTTLECYHCGNKNVFVLGFVSAKQESVVVILCRLPCAQSKDINWDTEQWQSLIEDRQFLPWVAATPTTEDQLQAKSITPVQMAKLEAKWRLNKEATLDDADLQEEEEILPILWRYTDAFQYQRSFAPLVQLEADYDRQLKESKALEHISINWSLGLNSRHLASFSFSTYESGEIKVAVGDEMILKYDGPELDEPWEQNGFIIRLPGALQEEFTLELNQSKNPPPTHLSNRFTAEFVWKGTAYERMQDALKTFAIDPESVSAYIYEKLLGKEVNEVQFDVKLPKMFSIPGAELNVSQANAVKNVLQRPLSLIQGPPGTGKTVTSATICYHLTKMNKDKILVCAPSNVAVDHLAAKLEALGLNVVRLTARSREDVETSIVHLSLHEIVKKKAKGELKKLIKLKSELGELSLEDSKKYIGAVKRSEKQILKNCDVICCTCVGAGDKRLASMKFRTVLIDEITQASEPECLIPIVKGAKQVILVGDHQQLGPVILNRKAGDAGLRQSLFERLIFLGHMPIRLEVQYRMHPCLSEFPSNMFYDGSLQNGVTAEERSLRDSMFPWPIRETPMMFWAVYGREEISGSGTSYLNRVEAMNTERVITKLFKDGIQPSQIGVITPYEGQRAYVVQYMQMNSTLADKSLYMDVEVASVDAFQGREKDYIILSCVRANEQQAIGFLSDPRRLNVALTRAKYGLFILGNPKALSKNRLWNHLLTHFREKGCLVEGQLDNLQLSSVQLTKIRDRYEGNAAGRRGLNSRAASSYAPSAASTFDTASLISYEGLSTYYNMNSNNNKKFPKIGSVEAEDDFDESRSVISSTDVDSQYYDPYINTTQSSLSGRLTSGRNSVTREVGDDAEIRQLTSSFTSQFDL